MNNSKIFLCFSEISILWFSIFRFKKVFTWQVPLHHALWILPQWHHGFLFITCRKSKNSSQKFYFSFVNIFFSCLFLASWKKGTISDISFLYNIVTSIIQGDSAVLKVFSLHKKTDLRMYRIRKEVQKIFQQSEQ